MEFLPGRSDAGGPPSDGNASERCPKTAEEITPGYAEFIRSYFFAHNVLSFPLTPSPFLSQPLLQVLRRQHQRAKAAEMKSRRTRRHLRSFFEAFVVGAVEELIEFHGGADTFRSRGAKRLHERLTIDHKPLQGTIAKLREPEKANARDRYRTASQKLATKNFRFPGELLASYGIRSLIEDIDKLKAFQIPYLLRSAFGVPLSEDDAKEFHRVRDKRNKVAHGNAGALNMRKVTEMSLFLRRLAVMTAEHLGAHFFVIEKFAP